MRKCKVKEFDSDLLHGFQIENCRILNESSRCIEVKRKRIPRNTSYISNLNPKDIRNDLVITQYISTDIC